MTEERKAFVEPELEIIQLEVQDVITTSTDDDFDWGAGDF